MNNVTLIGRLVRDPELRYLDGGTAVCKFPIAVDKGLSKDKKQELQAQNKPTADFINIVVWGKMAENSANYLVKGRLVGIQGRMQSGSYEKDGIRFYTTDVVANNVEFLEWGDKQQGQSSNLGAMEGFQPTDNDDIPF